MSSESVAESSTRKLEQSNPDYDENVVVEAQNLTKVYRDFWGRQKVQGTQGLGSGNSQG